MASWLIRIAVIVREVEPQALGDLLRAPRHTPSPVLPRPVPPSLPGHGRPGDRSPARGGDMARQAAPARRPAAPRSSRASPASGGGPPAPRATARWSPGTPGRHPASPRCAAALARSSTAPARGGGRPPARPGPAPASSAISSRSANDRYRPESGFDDRDRCDGGIPPASRNQRKPTGCDTPTPIAASSLDRPAAMNAQNRRRSSRRATPGRPGDLSLPRKPDPNAADPPSQHPPPGVATTT